MMDANFTPSLSGYSGQGQFRFWCQKVLPLVYEDSLSYYELLNKVVSYLNNTITDVASVEGNVTALLTAYNELQGYVNSYFDSLDVQNEINNKLDDMSESGTMSELLAPIVANDIGGVVAGQIDEAVGGQIDASVGRQINQAVSEEIGDVAPSIITGWLDENVDPVGSAVIVDDTLTISGAAADAKVTGEQIGDLKNATNGIIKLESGAFANDHITKGANVKRIRTVYPIPTDQYAKIVLPNGYTMYVWYFDKNMSFIGNSPGTAKMMLLPSVRNGTEIKYINLQITKTGHEDDDISGDVSQVENGLEIILRTGKIANDFEGVLDNGITPVSFTPQAITGGSENVGIPLRVASYNVALWVHNHTTVNLADDKIFGMRNLLNTINPDYIAIQEDAEYIDPASNPNAKSTQEYIFNPVLPYTAGTGGVSIKSRRQYSESKALVYSTNRLLR